MRKSKFFAILLPVLLIVTGFNNVFANTVQSGLYNAQIEAQYQEIINRLSKEYNLDKYGIRVERTTPEIRAQYGLPTPRTLTSPDAFEADLRKNLEISISDYERANAAMAARGINPEDEIWYECKPPETSTRATKSTTLRSPQGEFTANLDCVIGKTEDGTNIVRFQSVSNAYASNQPLLGIEFRSRSYSYSFLDSQRICAVKYVGDRVSTDWIEYNVTKYVEFYAVW